MIGDGGHAKVIRSFFPTANVIAIGDNRARRDIAERSSSHWGRATHVTATVDRSAVVGEGTVILEGAIIQTGVTIGKHCIINAGAVVCHDCVLEDFVHIAPGAHLCGNVHVGEGTLVGVGVGIAPNTTIPAWSLVKARRLEIEPCAT